VPGNAAIIRRGSEAFDRRDLAGAVVRREAVLARLGRHMAETGGYDLLAWDEFWS
jgi:hypothetical protein